MCFQELYLKKWDKHISMSNHIWSFLNIKHCITKEYIASANATKEAVWLQTLLQELDLPQKKATIIHTDNQGSIALAHNPVSHSRAKHIDIRHHFI